MPTLGGDEPTISHLGGAVSRWSSDHQIPGSLLALPYRLLVRLRHYVADPADVRRDNFDHCTNQLVGVALFLKQRVQHALQSCALGEILIIVEPFERGF